MPNSTRSSKFDWHLSTDFLGSNPDHLVEGVKQRLAIPVPDFDSIVKSRSTFPPDKWLLSSAVQKLIRRGWSEQAVKTALALHKIDPAYLPRRLPTIAFEDISIGDLGVCFDTLHVFGTQRFASGTDDLEQRRLVANLVYRLAVAVKSRTACDMVCLALAEPELLTIATKMASSSVKCLIKIAADRNAPDTKRSLALLLLSGLSIQEQRQYRTISRFNAEGLIAVAEKLGLPPVIAWMLVKGRNTSGLAAMLPLVLEVVSDNAQALHIVQFENSGLQRFAEKYIAGVPAYSADMHTSIGRQVITEFSKAIKQKCPRLFEGVPSVSKLLGMAIFHAESSKLDRWLENEKIADYRERVERVELEVLGLAPELHQKLYAMLDSESQFLWKIRSDHLASAFGGSK